MRKKRKRNTTTVTTPRSAARTVLASASLRRRLVLRRLALFAALFLIVPAIVPSPSTASAEQKPYALIFGTVFSAEGHLAYGVPVKVRRADKKKPLLEAMSDHSGEFAFRVPPGPADYVVWLDIKSPKGKPAVKDPIGVTSQTEGGVELKVHVQGDERVDISLHLPESLKPY
jgi:hypothetical protein